MGSAPGDRPDMDIAVIGVPAIGAFGVASARAFGAPGSRYAHEVRDRLFIDDRRFRLSLVPDLQGGKAIMRLSQASQASRSAFLRASAARSSDAPTDAP
jgi:hypothetical protein